MAAITTPVFTAPTRNPEPAPVVVAPVEASPVAAERPNIVAIYATSIAVVGLLFLVGVGVPVAMVYGNATGFGIGAMCAFWGGPSFGVMTGSARLSAWLEAHGEH